MPCPCFEPLRIASDRQHSKARLPLIYEYEGLCHAHQSPIASPASLRFQCCNQGYSRGICQQFPSEHSCSSLRYNVERRTESALQVTCIEEENYAPLRWYSIEYLIKTERLNPEIDDVCIRAQLIAFCRGYLARFS